MTDARRQKWESKRIKEDPKCGTLAEVAFFLVFPSLGARTLLYVSYFLAHEKKKEKKNPKARGRLRVRVR